MVTNSSVPAWKRASVHSKPERCYSKALVAPALSSLVSLVQTLQYELAYIVWLESENAVEATGAVCPLNF